MHGYPVRYCAYLGSYYMILAIFQGYLSLYFQSLGFNSTQIGTVFAAIALTSVFAQPVWGTVGDRMSSRSRLLRVLLVCALLIAQLFRFAGGSFPLLLLLSCAYACFFLSVQPLGDSIILDSMARTRTRFGPARLTGSLCFAVLNALAGRLFTNGRESWVIAFLSGTILFSLALSFFLPAAPGRQTKTGKKVSFAELFKNRPLMRLLLFTLPLHLTMGYFYTFFSPHFRSLEGGTSALLGWCYFLSAVSEIPFLVMSDRLIDRYGPGKLISVSALALTLRWLIVGASRSVPLVMASQLCHSWGFIVMTVSLAKYVTGHVDEELHASGQMLIAIVTYGVARVAGNLGGGVLADALGEHGRQSVFLLNSGICLATFLAFAPRYLKKTKKNAERSSL